MVKFLGCKGKILKKLKREFERLSEINSSRKSAAFQHVWKSCFVVKDKKKPRFA
jgi:hypothetical protein